MRINESLLQPFLGVRPTSNITQYSVVQGIKGCGREKAALVICAGRAMVVCGRAWGAHVVSVRRFGWVRNQPRFCSSGTRFLRDCRQTMYMSCQAEDNQ
eukprot:scaffold130087_cov24-Prasinocladus_malaysianus.AAC.1